MRYRLIAFPILQPAWVLSMPSSVVITAKADRSTVDQTLGRTGAVIPGGVQRYSFLCSDLHVTVDGVTGYEA